MVENSLDPVSPVPLKRGDLSSSDDSSPAAKRQRLDPLSCTDAGRDNVQQQNAGSDSGVGVKIPLTGAVGEVPIMVCDIAMRKAYAAAVKLEMCWVDGQSRELMHQLLQFFKNHFV